MQPRCPAPIGPHQLGRQVNGLPDAVIRAAAAGVRDLRVDVCVGGIRARAQQRERAHDHAGLAIPALRRVELLPGDLNRMTAVGRESLDGHHRLADGRGRRDTAGPDGAAIDVQRACAALSDAAAELRAGQPDLIADHPQQRRLRVRVDGMPRAVDDELERHTLSSSACLAEALAAGRRDCSRLGHTRPA